MQFETYRISKRWQLDMVRMFWAKPERIANKFAFDAYSTQRVPSRLQGAESAIDKTSGFFTNIPQCVSKFRKTINKQPLMQERISD